MEALAALLVVLSLGLLLVGLVSPRTSMFWAPQKATRLQSFLIYAALTGVAFLVFGLLLEVKILRN